MAAPDSQECFDATVNGRAKDGSKKVRSRVAIVFKSFVRRWWRRARPTKRFGSRARPRFTTNGKVRRAKEDCIDDSLELASFSFSFSFRLFLSSSFQITFPLISNERERKKGELVCIGGKFLSSKVSM